jgi:hypothetical protein
MIFQQVTDSEMQAARILSGAAMAAFLAAPLFHRRSQAVRIVVAGAYIAGAVAFTAYVLI